jgi:hypothetical protein
MTMNPIIHRVLMAYRPLYLNGLLMDGQYRLPSIDVSEGPSAPARPTRRRMLLVALTGLRQTVSSHRSKA